MYYLQNLKLLQESETARYRKNFAEVAKDSLAKVEKGVKLFDPEAYVGAYLVPKENNDEPLEQTHRPPTEDIPPPPFPAPQGGVDTLTKNEVICAQRPWFC